MLSNPQFDPCRNRMGQGAGSPEFQFYHESQRIDYRSEKLFIALLVPIGAAVLFFVVIASAFFAQPNTTSRVGIKSKLDTDATRNPVLNAFATADAAISTKNGATK